MNLKLFKIRLHEQHLDHDQEVINRFMEGVRVRDTSTQFVPDEPDYWSVMVYYDHERPPKPPTKESEKFTVAPDVELTDQEKEIIAALKQWRKDKANALNVPDFMICHNAELLAVTKRKPRSMADLGEVKGFGNQKIARHGDEIISVINAF